MADFLRDTALDSACGPSRSELADSGDANFQDLGPRTVSQLQNMTSSFVVDPRIRRPSGGLRALAAALLLASAGCSTGEPMPDLAPQINQTLRTDYDVIVPGDVLEVRFGDLVAGSKVWDDSKVWDHEVLVRPDGNAAFLGLGDRYAAGQSIEALRASVGIDYQKLLKLRTIDRFSILLKTKIARNVIVFGEVHTPGSVIFEGARMTLLEAIGRAGGPLKETARLDSLLLVRWDPETHRQISWKINADLDYWGTSVPVYMQPFDVVFIPNTTIDKVDIWIDQYFRKAIPIPINFQAITVGGGAH
jgi:protein involved in polysaccharide export with SLBB domain